MESSSNSPGGLRRAVGAFRVRLWHWRTRWFTEFALAAVARRVETLKRAEPAAPSSESLAVVSLMRDAGGYVDSFVEHYRALGVDHIVLLDNGSTDDSVERASKYDGVTVLRCDLPFRWFRTAMRRYMVETYGDGGWALLVDIDEHWDYPASDRVGLKSLLGYLNERSYTAVAAHMLDLFPRGPVETWPDAGAELKAAAVWFDLSDARRERLPAAAVRNTFAVEVPCLVGGMRSRAFGAEPCLTKFPLTCRAGGQGPRVENAHFVSGAKVAEITTVLLHYKFDSRFRERTEEAVRRKNYYGGSSEYRQYQKTLDADPSLTLKGAGAERFEDVNQLVERGLLETSAAFDKLAERQLRTRS